MKTINTLLLLMTFIAASSQQFQWAKSYDISNCNEVAALSIDSVGNIFIAGIHDAPFQLPYTGNAYLQKSNPQGDLMWFEELSGTLIIGDMAAIGDDVLIIGQSSGVFTYRGVQYGQGQFFMFVMMLDAGGNPLWYFTDENKWGANTNIAIGNTGNIALHIRGQSNLGDWILIVDKNGNILKSKQISATRTLVVDIAYYDDKIYFNGGFNGPGSITVDTILIELPPIENASITMGLDENLVAKWLYVDQTINNRDGRIEANSGGVFVYEDIIEPPFTSVASLKKFDFGGELIAEVAVPVFSNSISLYPDLAVSESAVGLFAQNDFNFDSHKIMLFDHDLNLLSEKEIDGPSDLYSGQIAASSEAFFVAHVFSGNLNFNNEFMLPYTGTGKKAYIAKIGDPPITRIGEGAEELAAMCVYPNPAIDIITVDINGYETNQGQIAIYNVSGKMVLNGSIQGNSTTIMLNELPSGIYFLQAVFPEGKTFGEKIFLR